MKHQLGMAISHISVLMWLGALVFGSPPHFSVLLKCWVRELWPTFLIKRMYLTEAKLNPLCYIKILKTQVHWSPGVGLLGLDMEIHCLIARSAMKHTGVALDMPSTFSLTHHRVVKLRFILQNRGFPGTDGTFDRSCDQLAEQRRYLIYVLDYTFRNVLKHFICT